MTALLSFLGGNVFRWIFGEIVSAWNKKQDHAHEMDRIKAQGEADAAQHARNMESLKTQAELQVKVITVQSEAAVNQIDAQAFLETVKATAVQTGFRFVDGWNAVIRPGLATWSVIMLTLGEFAILTLSENTIALAGVALGVYVADRQLFKRGK